MTPATHIALKCFLLIAQVWHLGESGDGSWYAGPRRSTEAYCWVDRGGRIHVNDLGPCLLILQNMDRLDLVPGFIVADRMNYSSTEARP